jgi:hypothetical protein
MVLLILGECPPLWLRELSAARGARQLDVHSAYYTTAGDLALYQPVRGCSLRWSIPMLGQAKLKNRQIVAPIYVTYIFTYTYLYKVSMSRMSSEKYKGFSAVRCPVRCPVR